MANPSPAINPELKRIPFSFTRLTREPIYPTSMAFMFVGPFAGVYLLFTDFSFTFSTNDYMLNLGYIAILAVIGTVLALVIFNTLIQHTSALFGASVTYFIPVFAIMWGLFDDENLSLIQFLWIGLIFTGVYLVNKRSKK